MDLCHYVLIFPIWQKLSTQSGYSFPLSPELLEANIINLTWLNICNETDSISSPSHQYQQESGGGSSPINSISAGVQLNAQSNLKLYPHYASKYTCFLSNQTASRSPCYPGVLGCPKCLYFYLSYIIKVPSSFVLQPKCHMC